MGAGVVLVRTRELSTRSAFDGVDEEAALVVDEEGVVVVDVVEAVVLVEAVGSAVDRLAKIGRKSD